jgi:hypothetical protein
MTVVGSFAQPKNSEFKASTKNLLESFQQSYQMDAVTDISKILRVDTLKEAYMDMLLEDVTMEGAADDPYYSMLPQKLSQLFENTAGEMLMESGVAALSPIVGITLPVLKKAYIEGHSKDIVMTEVPNKPIIKAAFERRFLKDLDGNKYYIPDVFYDEKYKEVISKGRGVAIDSSKLYPEGGTLPMQDFDILGANGGSIQKRDSLDMDFAIVGCTFEVDGNAVPVTSLNIQPDMGSQSTFQARIKAPIANRAGVYLEDILVGQVDFYHGTVSVASTAGYIKQVKFGGHLSNENNNNVLEIDRERELMEWKIPTGMHLNTGLTVEKIKDYKALFDFDITTEVISDMSTTLSQTEDSSILGFLNDSFDSWRQRDPELSRFGYTEGFVREGFFSCDPGANKYVTRSQYIESELKFDLNRFIDELKVLLKTPDLMFVIYGHPNNITLIQDNVRWVIDENTKIGGIQLDYKFGVYTANQNRCHVISTLKCPKSRGLRVVAYPLSKEVITFKHYKYSLNIENTYRNAATPLTPNIMATSRYLTTEVLPVQGEFHILNNDFFKRPEVAPTAQVATPVLLAEGTITFTDGEYPNGYQVVAYPATAGATLYYTVDGSTPSLTNGTAMPANGIITITDSCTLNVVAVKGGMIDSEIASATFQKN